MRLFSRQPAASRIINQLIISFSLKCSKTAGPTTPPKKEIKLSQGLHALHLKDAGELRLFWWFIDTPIHTNPPQISLEGCERPPVGRKGGREGLGSSAVHYHTQDKMHQKKSLWIQTTGSLLGFLCCVDSSGTDIHLVYIHTSDAVRTERKQES